MPLSSLNSLKESIELSFPLNIKEHINHQVHPNYRAAAVLITIFPSANQFEIILTKRSKNLPHHANQISLPGGSVESQDANPIETALREAQEEVSLDVTKIEVIGNLETVLLPSGFAVTPVISVMEQEPDLLADPAEVEQIFTIPLHLLLEKNLYKEDSIVRNGIKRNFYHFDYKEYYIWGATAGILRSLAIGLNRSKV